MQNKRRIAVFAAPLAALLLIVAPLSAAGAERTRGKSTATLHLIDGRITSVPELGEVSASLGRVTTLASLMGDDPHAHVLVEALEAAGQELGTYIVSSEDEPNNASQTFPLSGPGVSGSLTLANIAAYADDVSAKALLEALEAELNLAGIGFDALTGTEGATSQVDPGGASSYLGFTSGPVSVDLADLVPAEVLENLPLSLLAELADQLDLELQGVVQDVLNQLAELNVLLDDVQTTIDDLAGAEAELDELLALQDALPGAEQAVADAEVALAEAQAAVDAAQAVVDDLTAQQQALEAQIADLETQLVAQEELLAACTVDCALIQATIDSLEAEIAALETELAAVETDLAAAEVVLADAQVVLADAQAELDAAQAELDAIVNALAGDAIAVLQALIDELQAQLDALLETLFDIIVTLPDLDSLRADLLAQLEDVSLVDIGRIEIGLSTTAYAKRGAASIDCVVQGVSAGGESLGVDDCDELLATVEEINAVIAGVLALLPGSLPDVSLSGLQRHTEASDAPDADGWTRAAASITPLDFSIGSMSLQGVEDELIAELVALLDGIDPALLGDAEQVLLADLQAQLDALPTGAALEGLSTSGLELAVAGASSESSFNPAEGDTGEPDDPNDPDDPDDPVDEVPQNRPPTAPISSGSPLPFTGTGLPVAAFVALAAWLMAVGAFALTAGRRRTSGMISP